MKKVMIFALATMLFGCASVSRWEPTLNDKVGKNQASAAQDIAECRVLADKAAGWVVEGTEATLVSAAGGAAEGAVIGALISGAGGAGVAAAAGAPIGAIAGLWYSEYDANLNFKRAFSNCLYQRGQYPIN
jgi:outer membrane lipoprotein SlyB